MEVWKKLTGFDNYEISNKGMVKSLQRKSWNGSGWFILKEKLLKTTLTESGYLRVSIYDNKGVAMPISVHRLVALTFINNPENKPQVNHKNGIKHDNNVENLEWVTVSENAIHSYKNGFSKISEKHRKTASLLLRKRNAENHATAKPVIDTKTGIEYKSVVIAAIENKIKRTTLHGYLTGKFKNKTTLTYK